MATTIKVDGTVADWTWQDDQPLDPAEDVDYFVQGKDDYVPLSTVGTGSDAPSTQSGFSGADTVKATTTKSAK